MLFKSATRRAFLVASGLAAIGTTGCASSKTTQTASSTPTRATAIPTPGKQVMPSSNQALQKLLDGNLRFEQGETIDHHTTVPDSIQALVDYIRPSVLQA